ncbi:MAG: MFS transporter [Dehalococcoidia bacterium]
MLKQEHLHQGMVLGGAILVFFSIASLINSYGVFLPFISEGMGWSRGAVSGVQSLCLFLSAVLSPLVGAFIGKYGPRKSIILGGLVVVVGLLGLSQITALWHLYILWGLLVGGGWAFAQMIPATTVVTNWFVGRRPLALSLVMTSGGVAGLIAPPIITYTILSTSWKVSWLFLSAFVLLFCVAIAVFLIKDKPVRIGHHLNSTSGVSSGTNLSGVEGGQIGRPSVFGVMHSFVFWQVVIISVATLFTFQTIVVHQVAYLIDLGYSPTIAAVIFGLMMGVGIAGRFGYGLLASKFSRERLVTVFLGMTMTGILFLMGAVKSPLLLVYVALFGFGCGALMVALVDLLVGYYGPAIYPRLQGWVRLFRTGVGSAPGPWIAGSIHDMTHEYYWAFIIVLGVLSIGFVVSFFLKPPTARSATFERGRF